MPWPRLRARGRDGRLRHAWALPTALWVLRTALRLTAWLLRWVQVEYRLAPHAAWHRTPERVHLDVQTTLEFRVPAA